MTQAVVTALKSVAALASVLDESPSAQEIIRVENLCKTYQLGEVDVPVLNGMSLSIRRGEMVALMGASGSGKTTLMNILGCLDRPSSGEYWLDGQEMSELAPHERALVRGAKIGFVFQNFNLLARTTALNNVLMPLNYALGQPSHTESKRRASQLLALVGLEQRLHHEPSRLSGGQQQRVAIARALVNMPPLILADEPTGNLDSHTSVEILRTFQQLNAAGITVILVTHDPKVASFAHRTIHISDGLIDSNGGSRPHQAPMSHAVHGESLLNLPSGRNGATDIYSGSDSVEQVVALINLLPRLPTPASSHPTAGTDTTMSSIAKLTPLTAASGDAKLIKTRVPRRSVAAVLPMTFRTALTALRRNKLRTGLTTLGIVIGIAAVIAMVEVGQGSSNAIQQTIAKMGAGVVQIDPNGVSIGGVSTGAGGRATLSAADCEAILRKCPSVRWAAPSVDCRMQVMYGHRNWAPHNILGTTPAFLQIRDWTVDEGESFTEGDVVRAANVCLIGKTPLRELFRGELPIGRTIRINNVPLKVVGVLSSKGANMAGWDQDDMIIVPLTTVKFHLSGIRSINATTAPAAAPTLNQANSLNQLYPTQTMRLYSVPTALQTLNNPQLKRFLDLDDVWVSATAPRYVAEAISEITDLLRERHRLQEEDADDFRVRDLTEISKTLASTSRLMTNLLTCVAVISLVVGGVGIMNIMLVSVTERTHEIGLRMAVGARGGDILWQFLVEAVLVCLVGGLAGIVLGRGVSIAITAVMSWPTMVSLPAILAAVAVSVVVGVIFGFYPAWKASRLNPIEALRYE
jgi:macrolide transport system ATP-binding/permease protein